MQKGLKFIFLACLILAVSACGSEKEETINKDNKKYQTTEDVSTDNNEGTEDKETKNGVASKGEEPSVSSEVYQDRFTSGNRDVKKILYENLKMNDTKNIEDVIITLEGIQYAEITPSEATKSKFKNINERDRIIITMKIKIVNNFKQPLIFKSIRSFLRGNDNQIIYLPETNLEPSQQGIIAAGTSSEKLHVFLIDKDLFSNIRNLKLEFGPFLNSEGKDLFNGKKTEFEIPLPN